jgi:ABC-2 type transport system permease protein
LKKRLREAFYIGMLDILPLLRDPMMMILLTMFSFMPVLFIAVFAGMGGLATQALIGAVVLSLFFGGIQVANSSYYNKHWFRFQDIYVASTISPISYVIGLSLATLIGSFPGLIIAVAFLLVSTSVSISSLLMLLLISFLLWVSTLFLGFAIGSSVKDTRRANSIPQILGFFLGFLPPVYYPLDKLPEFLQPVMMLLPTTHGAQLAKYYLGMIVIPDWQVLFGWVYLIVFMLLMALFSVKWSKWVDP